MFYARFIIQNTRIHYIITHRLQFNKLLYIILNSNNYEQIKF